MGDPYQVGGDALVFGPQVVSPRVAVSVGHGPQSVPGLGVRLLLKNDGMSGESDCGYGRLAVCLERGRGRVARCEHHASGDLENSVEHLCGTRTRGRWCRAVNDVVTACRNDGPQGFEDFILR